MRPAVFAWSRITPRVEEEFGRQWKKYARSKDKQFPRMPSGSGGDHNRTRGGDSEIDNVFGDGRSIARMSHAGMFAADIAAAHSMSKTSLQSWLSKHKTTLMKLRAKYPTWMETAE